MEKKFKVVFRGDIAAGFAMVEVQAKLRDIFNLDDQGIGKLFVGRPVVIKKNLDQITATKWCEILLKAGALAEYLPEQAERQLEAGAGSDAAQSAVQEPVKDEVSYGLELSPVGADVLKPSERRPESAQEIPTAHLSVEEVGADVLKESERTPYVELDLDVSHLNLQETASDQ